MDERCSLCAVSGVPLRPAHWAAELQYCTTCWAALEQWDAIPYWTELEAEESSDG